MLTADLVRATAKGGVIKPGFVDFATPKIAERAGEILAAVRGAVGQRRKDIEEELEGILGDAVDAKLFGGLAKIAFDSCEFEVRSPVEPRELRRLVWLESARRGPLVAVAVDGGLATPGDVYAAVATQLTAASVNADEPTATAAAPVNADELADAMFADRADEQRLTECKLEKPEDLVNRYNLGLVQALLFSAHHLDIELATPTPARARQLFRAIKFHQLLFAVTPTGSGAVEGGYRIRLDGPASLFAQSSRYGLALAKFLPTLLLQPGPWTLRSEVTWGRFRPSMVITHETGLVGRALDHGAYETRESQWFAERFLALDSGWSLDRDAQPILQGPDSVVVPAFSFRKGGKIAHLEILGFWRKASIERRLEMLGKYGPKNLVVAVSKRYATEKDGELPEAVIPFAEVIPAKEVLRRIEAMAIKEVVKRKG